jgi:hypothetical protein
MHPALLQALASQRAAQLPMTVVNGHQQPASSTKPARLLRQRIGWALVQVGLHLAVGRERA